MIGLKALQWVYDLGVNQERNRIARILEQSSFQNDDYIGNAYNIIRDDANKMSASRKNKLEHRAQVMQSVNDIINRIMRVETEYVGGSSLMFPEDK